MMTKTVVSSANGGMKSSTMTQQQTPQQQQQAHQNAAQQQQQQPGTQQQQSLSGCVVSQTPQFVTTQAPTATMLGPGQAQLISQIPVKTVSDF